MKRKVAYKERLRKKRSDRIMAKRKKIIKVTLVAILILTTFIFGISLLIYNMIPALQLRYSTLKIEAGSDFNEYSMIKKIKAGNKKEVKIDLGGLNTNVPGKYKLTYTFKDIVRSMEINVKDTKPPVIECYKEYEVEQYGTVTMAMLVAAVHDVSPTNITFSNGLSEYTFNEEGVENLEIIATDSYGNTTTEVVSVNVVGEDVMAPEIHGADEITVPINEEFDIMKGVTVTDDKDDAPVLTADIEKLDTSVPREVTITYTATDKSGNISYVKRRVTISRTVANYNNTDYEITWDTTGIISQPYLIAVNKDWNTVTVYTKDVYDNYTVPYKVCLCSIGDSTPTGYFITLERYRWKDLYENSYGQYATRITGHILFHSVPYYSEDPSDLEYNEFNLLGTPASLGCVRMCVEDVKWIYDNCPKGFPCVIYNDPSSPGPMGKPEAIKIDVTNYAKRGWDPTDPDSENPWLN